MLFLSHRDPLDQLQLGWPPGVERLRQVSVHKFETDRDCPDKKIAIYRHWSVHVPQCPLYPTVKGNLNIVTVLR